MPLLERAETRPGVRCDRCATAFRPSLTAWACPVCGLEAGRPEPPGRLGGWLADPGNRIVALVAGATVANGVLLLLLALAVARSG